MRPTSCSPRSTPPRGASISATRSARSWLSNTVGCICELPHQLVAAFRSTLEETIHADLLLHVVDASSAVRLEQIEQVNDVLHEIGADAIRQVLVFNKIDAVPELAARGGAVERAMSMVL